MSDELRFSIEYRADDTRQSPGRLVGRLVRYGEQATDRRELFEPGALEWPTDGVVLNRQHVREKPILRFVPQVDGNEVRVDAQLPDTSSGRDTAVEVRSGLLRGLSIEFKAIKETYSGGVRRISRAMLKGAGLVDSPSYLAPVEVRRRVSEEDQWRLL